MATFIEIRTDAFADNVNNIREAGMAGMSSPAVRRPLRGIEIKDDRYATIMIKQANGMPIALTDAGSRAGVNSGQSTSAAGGIPATVPTPAAASSYIYSNFIIESIEESRQEKTQIMETFGEPYIFFFGEKPRMLNVSGLLFNTLDFNWRSEFWENYDKKLRGTKLVEQNARMYLHWDDIVVEGYPIGAQAAESADMPYTIKFAFSLFITNYTTLSSIGSDDYPTRSSYRGDLFQGNNTDPSFKDTLLNGKSTEAGIKQLTSIAKNTGASLTAVALANALKKSDNTHAATANQKILKSALAAGLQSSSITFMNVVQEYFKGKRVANPKRVIPWRSKIRDNTDEYVTDGDGGIAGPMAPFDLDYIAYMRAKQEKAKTIENTVGYIQMGMALTGVDPIKTSVDAVTSPFNHGHSVSVVQSTPATSLGLWGSALSGR
jgi:hypothetical protein